MPRMLSAILRLLLCQLLSCTYFKWYSLLIFTMGTLWQPPFAIYGMSWMVCQKIREFLKHLVPKYLSSRFLFTEVMQKIDLFRNYEPDRRVQSEKNQVTNVAGFNPLPDYTYMYLIKLNIFLLMLFCFYCLHVLSQIMWLSVHILNTTISLP